MSSSGWKRKNNAWDAKEASESPSWIRGFVLTDAEKATFEKK